MVKAEGFDVNRSQVSASALANFLAEEIREDITSVPGIGPAAAAALATDADGEPGVKTTYQCSLLVLHSNSQVSLSDWQVSHLARTGRDQSGAL